MVNKVSYLSKGLLEKNVKKINAMSHPHRNTNKYLLLATLLYTGNSQKYLCQLKTINKYILKYNSGIRTIILI